MVLVCVTAYPQTSAPSTDVRILHGMDITETNTGVPANNGARFLEYRKFISGARLIIAVDGFTVRRCSFFGRGGISLFANSGNLPPGKNVRIEYCTLDGNNENTGGDPAIYGSGIYLKRVHVRRWPRAMWTGDGNVIVEECYFHDITCDGGDAHLENIYVAGGANQTFIRSKLVSNEIHINGDNRMMTSASLAIYNENYERGNPFPSFPRLENIQVKDNYFESDGHFALYAGALAGKFPAPFARNLAVTGNIFGRNLHRNSGVSGPAAAFDSDQPGNIWKDNTWGPRGPYWKAGDAEEGAAIPAPLPF